MVIRDHLPALLVYPAPLVYLYMPWLPQAIKTHYIAIGWQQLCSCLSTRILLDLSSPTNVDSPIAIAIDFACKLLEFHRSVRLFSSLPRKFCPLDRGFRTILCIFSLFIFQLAVLGSKVLYIDILNWRQHWLARLSGMSRRDDKRGSWSVIWWIQLSRKF